MANFQAEKAKYRKGGMRELLETRFRPGQLITPDLQAAVWMSLNEAISLERKVSQLERQIESLEQDKRGLAQVIGEKNEKIEALEYLDKSVPKADLPAFLSPGRYLVGYAAASFYGVRWNDPVHSEDCRYRMDKYLMAVCPEETKTIAIAMHNNHLRSNHEIPISSWEEYIDRAIKQHQQENGVNRG